MLAAGPEKSKTNLSNGDDAQRGMHMTQRFLLLFLAVARQLRPAACAPETLVFHTPKGTPRNPQNLYNRELAPACDAIGEPRVSWHSFRHTRATLLHEAGESLKTAQALLGHSNLGTTLGYHTHAIRGSQRKTVERVAGFWT